ncbi:MAG: hypothetical protein MJB14_00910, partial [Spirochaetes bacterium]|nr:hypothetical protein [Spirochaetota bacterium]
MKKQTLLLFLCLFITFSGFSTVKIDRIAVIDLEKVIATVFSGKSGSVQSIKTSKEKMQEKLNEIKDKILKIEELKLQAATEAKKIAYDKQIQQLKKIYSDYYKKRSYEIDKMVKNIQ